MATYTGEVMADYLEIRFPFSGKVEKVHKQSGEKVSQGEIIASLERIGFQTELDSELADYERVRADFEIFKIKNGEITTDLKKFELQEKQASLNAAVKNVELAKLKLDQVEVRSPAPGYIIDMRGLTSGQNTTPASSAIVMWTGQSLHYEFEIDQGSLSQFRDPRQVTITLTAFGNVTGTTRVPVWGKAGKFTILVTLQNTSQLVPGMIGSVTV